MKNETPPRRAARRLLSALTVFVTAVLLTACSDDYAKILPEDCAGVVKVDADGIAEKARLSENPDWQDWKDRLLEKAEEQLSGSSYKKLKEMLDNPKEFGIDLRKPLYFFAPSKSFPYAGVVAKMLDDDDFEEFVEMVLKETEEGRIKEYENCKIAVDPSGKTAVAFDEEAVMLAVAMDGDNGRIARDINRRFGEKEESSIFDNPAFKEMNGRDDDVTACLIMKNLLKVLPVDEREEMKQLCKATRLQDWSLVSGLRFGDDDVEAYIEPIAGTEEAKREMEKAKEMLPAVQGKHLSRLADDAFLVLGSGLNGKKYWDYISKIDVIKRELDRNPEPAAMLRDVVCTIAGEWTAGIAAPSLEAKDVPVIDGFVEINDKAVINRTLDSLRTKFGTKTIYVYNEGYDMFGGDMYTQKTVEVMSRDAAKGTYRFIVYPGDNNTPVVTMGTETKTFYFSTRNDFDATAKPKKSLADADFASRIKGELAFAVLDFRKLFENEVVRKGISRSGMEQYAEKLETAEIHVDRNCRYSIQVRFRDLGKKENPLTMLGEMISDITKKSGF